MRLLNFYSKTVFKLRDAIAETDAASVLSIYSPFISETLTSFEFDVPTEVEIKRRIRTTQQHFPWLICEAVNVNDIEGNNVIAGYAYGSKHRDREGYQWVSEVGIYLSPAFRGQGAGKILYNKLCEILANQGYFIALAIIAGDNQGSIEFHKSLGFQFVGEWKNYGNKFGKWCDVTWYSKQLQKFKENPEKPKAYEEVRHLISVEI